MITKLLLFSHPMLKIGNLAHMNVQVCLYIKIFFKDFKEHINSLKSNLMRAFIIFQTKISKIILEKNLKTKGIQKSRLPQRIVKIDIIIGSNKGIKNLIIICVYLVLPANRFSFFGLHFPDKRR